MKAAIIPVTQFQQNCSLLWCEATKQAAVIDPGGDVERILAVAKEHDVNIVKILLTHAHLDHAGGTESLAKQLQLPIEGPHKGDQFLIDSLSEQCLKYGFPATSGFTPNRYLEQGDEVSLGNETLEVFHCPGHTPGHVVFFSRSSRLAVVGDVLFQGSVGRSDLPGGSHDTLVNSIVDNLWPLGGDVQFIPGHGPTSTFGHERKTNPYVGDDMV